MVVLARRFLEGVGGGVRVRGGKTSEVGTIALLSFRLGGTDGVSIIADRWARILTNQGWDIITVAGEGPVDRIVPGLEIDAVEAPRYGDIEAAIDDADLVIVENALTIPINLPGSRVLAEVLAGRPALLHHHDPPWHRARFEHITELPIDDGAWEHVTINMLTEQQYADRGIQAHTIYNPFDHEEPRGDRMRERERVLGAAGLDPDHALLVSHPVRAIERKNVPEALNIGASVQANLDRPVAYWLPGPAEEGYAPTLERVLAEAEVEVVRLAPTSMPDLYAASDLVVFPSTWEGFGNVPVEASVHHKPVVVGHYAVGDELTRLGFRWFHPENQAAITHAVGNPAAYAEDAAHNHSVVGEFLSVKVVGDQMKTLFEEFGWTP